jgi:hypothetical protein
MSQKRIIDDYKVEEYKEKKGKGFIKLLSELQWVYNAELDNDRPYETERILWKKRVYFIGLGGSLALSMHFALSVTVFFNSLIASLLSPTLGEVINGLGMVWKVGTLLLIPVWLIKKYHLWDRGITRLLLHYTVVYGYIFTIAVLAFSFGMLSVIFYGGLAFLSQMFPEVKKIAVFLGTHLPFLVSTWGLLEYPLEFLVVVGGTLWYLKRMDKKHKFEAKPYTLLDDIPAE